MESKCVKPFRSAYIVQSEAVHINNVISAVYIYNYIYIHVLIMLVSNNIGHGAYRSVCIHMHVHLYLASDCFVVQLVVERHQD